MFLYHVHIGVLGSLFSFLQFLASPLAGCLSDCYGRKPALLVSMVYISLILFPGIIIIKLFVMCFQIGIAASYALWVVSDNFILFVLARAVGGISKANVSLATAVMADITDSTTRAKAMVTLASPK